MRLEEFEFCIWILACIFAHKWWWWMTSCGGDLLIALYMFSLNVRRDLGRNCLNVCATDLFWKKNWCFIFAFDFILKNLQCFVCVEDHTKHGIVIIDMILHLSAQELLTMRHHSGSSKENVHAEHIRTHIQFVWPGQVKDRIGLRWTRHLWMGVWKWCMHLPLLRLRT